MKATIVLLTKAHRAAVSMMVQYGLYLDVSSASEVFPIFTT